MRMQRDWPLAQGKYSKKILKRIDEQQKYQAMRKVEEKTHPGLAPVSD